MGSNLRPTFLTVLCVLTFVFSGFSIFNGITNYSNTDAVIGMTKDILEDTKDKLEQKAKNDDFTNKLMDKITDGMSAKNVQNNAIATIIASIFTLVGAVLMWGLDKRGFWLYVIGTVVTIIAPFFVFGGWIGLANAGFYMVLGIVFCVLYGLNLKVMH